MEQMKIDIGSTATQKKGFFLQLSLLNYFIVLESIHGTIGTYNRLIRYS